jgi:transposase InsO family protein
MRELSVAEQRYQAVLAVISHGETVTEVAARFGVARKTVHAWLAKYEAGGLESLKDGSHRPRSCPHQIDSVVEVEIARMRIAHPGWGPRRLVFELGRLELAEPVPSESAVYRALVRLNLIDPAGRRRRDRKWKRWERGAPMELWQMDVVGGFVLADGTRAKALTGVDDHSRFCVSAHLMVRETSRNVCEGLAAALRAHGVPVQILTDNSKVFTGRYGRPPVEVLFDRVCRENGVEHLLTQPRSPTTTGKICEDLARRCTGLV